VREKKTTAERALYRALTDDVEHSHKEQTMPIEILDDIQ